MAHDEHIRIRCRLCNEAFKYGHIVVVQIGLRIISGLKGCITKAHCWEVVIAKPHVVDLVTLRHGEIHMSCPRRVRCIGHTFGTPRFAFGPTMRLKPISCISIADRVTKLMIRSIGSCPQRFGSGKRKKLSFVLNTLSRLMPIYGVTILAVVPFA